jgi:hypothetical protein
MNEAPNTAPVESPRTRHRLRAGSPMTCGRCRLRPRASETQRWCRECRNAYQQEIRALQALDESAWAKDDGPLAGVYFIVSGVHVKIGVSADVRGRLRVIQNANPERVIGAGFIPEPNPGQADVLEATLHQRFAQHRYRGEWFLLCPEIHKCLVDEAQPWPKGGRS